MEKYYFLNGEIVPASQAKIAIGDIAIGRGYGVFDYFQMKEGIPLFRSEHLDRFIQSCSFMKINISHTKEDLLAITDELFAKNRIDKAGVKLIATGGVSDDGFSPGKASVAVQILNYYEPAQEIVDAGIKLLSFEYQRLLPHIKSTNYLYNVYLSDQLKAAGAMEPLYYTEQSVRETARANIFAVINGKLITSGEKILSGINREKTLGLGYLVELRDITLEEMKNADEVFLTGTTKRAIGVTQIDDAIIGDGKPGKFTMEIRNKLLELEKGMLIT
jgi:branched-subunit amino acid aminotransferase/4-amino-4-deoxychorismate lyase